MSDLRKPDTSEQSEPKTVFEILGIEPGNTPPPPVLRVDPPRSEGVPTLPPPGIYFDMPMATYVSLPALSNSGVKLLAASPMIFWSRSWLNPKYKSPEADHFIAGEAYHCRVCEGRDAFQARYAPEYEPDEKQRVLKTVDDIKHEISSTVSIVGTSEIRHTPVTTIEEPDGKGGMRQRKAKREDWVKQLLEIAPDAPIAELLEQRYCDQFPGKILLPQDLIDRIEIAAAMIERDEGLAPYFRGGMPEVTLIWYCPITGVPMKMRADYLKVRRIVDLKTYENQRLRAPETAIRYEISSYHYNVQVSAYIEGAREVRKLIREHGASAIYVCGDPTPERVEQCQAFATKWAQHVETDLFTFLFQMKGDAPITRAVHFPMGTVKMVTDDIISLAKKRFAECAATFGADPWIDRAPAYTIPDEEIPLSAVDI